MKKSVLARWQKNKGSTRSKSLDLAAPTRENYLQLANEIEKALQTHVLKVWFPRCLDKDNGGFSSDFTREWKVAAKSGGKFSVFQGRMTWISAQICIHRPELKDQFFSFARHGFEFLSNVMWDKENGGFFWGLDDQGRVFPFYGDNKHLYGMSFCLLGSTATYSATGDSKALQLAQDTFHWMDVHAHDAKNGGYFEWVTRDGNPLQPDPRREASEMANFSTFPVGYKSMNTHIHLLESFLQLYQVWKNKTLQERLEELLLIVRDRICVEPGAMNLLFTNGWKAIPGHDSYGHDLEVARFLLEAEEFLRQGHYELSSPSSGMAKMLVDHALNLGWDKTHGGFYREGTALGKSEDKKKEWWVQAEGLDILSLMHQLYGSSTEVYLQAFLREWQFIQNHLIDHQFGGLYEMVQEDGTPIVRGKGRIWKAAYHDGGAFLRVTDRLLKLSSENREG